MGTAGVSDLRTWFVERRLDYIDWLLATAGSIRLGDLVRTYGVSRSQASHDLNLYLRLHPEAMRYDLTARAYVAGRVPARLAEAGPARVIAEAAARLASDARIAHSTLT